jgi:hypothetical protein
MNALVLLLTLTSTLVLRSGERIPVEGAVREERGVVTFRSNGRLYSMPRTEIDRIEKEEEAKPAPAPVEVKDPKSTKSRPRLAVSEEERKRLLAELEKNHGGVAREVPIVREIPPPPSPEEAKEQRADENEWRRRAREHEEAVRRATEDLELLETRVAELQEQIQGFLSLGYKPRQFSYQTTELERNREQLPYARLELKRAQRAHDEFREDARKQGILPGWLR